MQQSSVLMQRSSVLMQRSSVVMQKPSVLMQKSPSRPPSRSRPSEYSVIILNTNFIICNTDFIIFNTDFMMFSTCSSCSEVDGARSPPSQAIISRQKHSSFSIKTHHVSLKPRQIPIESRRKSTIFERFLCIKYRSCAALSKPDPNV